VVAKPENSGTTAASYGAAIGIGETARNLRMRGQLSTRARTGSGVPGQYNLKGAITPHDVVPKHLFNC